MVFFFGGFHMLSFSNPDTAMPSRAYAYARGLGLLLAGLLGSGMVHAQAAKRCDLTVNSTPGAGADSTCLDLVSLSNGGPAIQTADDPSVTAKARHGRRAGRSRRRPDSRTPSR